MTNKETGNGDDFQKVRSENEHLREKLSQYRTIEEDLISYRVYGKAKRLLFESLSVIGIAVAFFGYLGFEVISERIVNIVAPKIEKKAEEEMHSRLAKINKNISSLSTELFFGNYNSNPVVRSEKGDTQIEIEFVNDMNETVIVYWIDYEGNSIEYFRLRPGEKRKQVTYATHPWVVKTESEGRVVKSIIGQVDQKRLLIGTGNR